MGLRLPLEIQSQPDEITCGPTCLHAIYRYFGDDFPLKRLITEVQSLEGGGTLAVFLACHALRQDYAATIYSYNLEVFDPTWFITPGVDMSERLRRQMQEKADPRLRVATRGYLEFLERGGSLRFVDLTRNLIRGYLKRGIPILTGLSATYLYRTAREFGPNDEYDDIRGHPSGHFVVLSGYDRERRNVVVNDPLRPSPVAEGHRYEVNIDRVLGAIMLGVLTHDANLLIIRPKKRFPTDHPCPP